MTAVASSSALYTGWVMHRRLRPRRHRLRYGVYSLLIDLDELPALHDRLRWFSVNRFNLFSWHERDYGDGAARGLRTYIEDQLRAANLRPGGAIHLLTMPRILGYAFNPLSVYFCHDLDGRLQAILYEVNNTFGERHSYLLPCPPEHDRQAAGLVRQTCAKNFHVSPFLGLDMYYDFSVSPPSPITPDLRIHIDARAEQGVMLTADLQSIRRPLTDATLVRAFFSHPLLTLKVIAAIHWEALKLVGKGIRLHRKPPPPAHAVSIPPSPPSSD
ncbi:MULTISPECIES: DUF1365 family protein [unclassified Acidovorax]|uniref:DUF1365 domain-containing protein n=1 Tax=unclassified Acidovorax TaxID=2684926 RepID=UPI002882DA80|nr:MULTISPECIES: DUF1365 family protein [unclassified Acidovorax]